MTMRRNRFGEAYCTEAADIDRELEIKEQSPALLYAVQIPSAAGEAPALEVLTNVEGDTVLYIEGKTYQECVDLARAAGISVEV